MCGLIGFAGNIFLADKQAIKYLHYFDELRGEHSTGMAFVEHSNHFYTAKSVGHVHKFWEEHPEHFDDKDHTVKKWDLKALIGHNRYATVGDKTAENAHPFSHGNIVGAHNGTLSYQHLHQLDGSNLFDVDSEAVFYSINKNGLKETIATMHGAWALVWYDKSDNTMNFIRNKERPLFYTWKKGQSTLYWASEAWMLLAALSKAKIEHEDVKSFLPDHHYYIDLGPKGDLKDKTLFYCEEKYTGFTPPVNSYQGFMGENYWGDYVEKYENRNNDKGFPTPKIIPPVVKNTPTYGELQIAYEKVRKLLSKEITFSIFGESVSNATGIYLLAESFSLPTMWEIRIYGDDHKSFEEWRNSNCEYTATVKAIKDGWNNKTNKHDRYVLLDLRTIKEVTNSDPLKKEEEKSNIPFPQKPNLKLVSNNSKFVLPEDLEWDVNRTYKGLNGTRLTFTEFMQAVNKGCIFCGDRITSAEADDVVFVQQGRLLCGICIRNDHTLVSRYISQKKA